MKNNNLQDNKKIILEKVYIIQPILTDNYKVLHDEAISLIESANAIYAGSIYQTLKTSDINPATFIGIGKLEELRQRLQGLEEITVLFNGELSPSQTLNISAALEGRKVIDRTTLILDIFAQNAQSSEGKIQVELAQLKYLYPRLKGSGIGLSRLGGGIGSRGPGETKLESDRRLIRSRIKFLSRKLEELQSRRLLQTTRRKKNQSKTIALVGYTNTGKSTLMNLLTSAGVFVKNELFATLDPTARSFFIDKIPFILIDTVGFLQELPHSLIEAFHSTLESASNCDLALIVCDAQSEYDMQLKTTLSTLKELNFNSPYLIVMNKYENVTDESLFPYGSICISAKENIGIDNLKKAILEKLKENYIHTNLFIPYTKMDEYNKIKSYCIEQNSEFTDDGQKITAVLPIEYSGLFKSFIE